MNARRLRLLADRQTGIARKVLAATPIAEHWTVRQIASELHRQGHGTDLTVIGGCLTTLLGQGLIRLHNGAYQRVQIEEEPVSAQDAKKPTTPAASAPAASPVIAAQEPTAAAAPAAAEPPLQQLDGIARRLREKATAVLAEAQLTAASLRDTADAIDKAALAFDGEVDKAKGAGKKLEELRALLKEVAA